MEIGLSNWLGRQDSNLRMSTPKTDALPLGDAPNLLWPPIIYYLYVIQILFIYIENDASNHNKCKKILDNIRQQIIN